MYERLLILFLTTLATLLLAGVVWLKNPHTPVNRYFALFALSGGAWILSNGLVAVYAATSWGILWARAAFLSAAAIPAAFFLFATVFPVPTPPPSLVARRLLLLSGVGAATLSLTPLIALRTSSPNGVLHVTYGPLHPVFGAYIVGAFGYSLFLLHKKRAVLSGLERLQLRYVFLAVSIPLVGGTLTNLLVPVLLNSSRFNQYGPLFAIPMIAIIAHTIIRYRLMNTKVVIRRSVAYIVTSAVAAGVFTLLITVASLSSSVFVSRPQDLPVSVEVGLVVLIAIIFQPVLRHVQSWLDRYLFRERYDYQKTLREISRTLSSLLSLQSVLSYACETITRTVRPEYVSVYTWDPAGDIYRRLMTHSSIPGTAASAYEAISPASGLASHLSATKRVLISHELSDSPAPNATHLVHELKHLSVDLALPVIHDDQMTGFFLVGRKLSGDPYFTDDIDLLTTLLSQATVALKNAQLYSQVVLVNEHIENILTTMESGVVAVDAKGHITLFNPAAERLLGVPHDAAKLSSLNALPASLANLLQGGLYDSQPRTQIEVTIDTDPLEAVSLLCSTSPLRDRAGTMLGVVAVFSDLTRLKTLESEKRQAERLASVGALASGIAHEIKNPLVAIKTFAELLPERFSEEDFRTDFSKVMITEIARIDDLVARLRGLATAANHSLVSLDVRVPLEETLALLRGQLEQARITTLLEMPNYDTLIAGDLAQLKQLFLNVLMNAVEAMDPGGQISIRVNLRGGRGEQTVHIEITDAGPGIPDSLRSRIFDPFVTTKPRGSGLGLSICRGIVDAHRGTIRAHSNERGVGTTILIEFPALHGPLAPTSATR